jgi:hypothetical protein
MATTLKLEGSNKPYKFTCLGVEDESTNTFNESDLFPNGTKGLELTSGKFPMTDHMNRYNKSKKTHVIGGKTVRIVGFSYDCQEGELNKYGGCEISVVKDEEQNGGKRSRRNRSRRNRSRRNRSTRRRY